MKYRKGLVFLALVLLCALLGGAALAEDDNVILWRTDFDQYTGYSTETLTDMFVSDSQIYGITMGSGFRLLCFDPETHASRTLDTQELSDRYYGALNENGSREEISCWFTWKDQVYALITRYEYSGDEALPPEGGLIRRLVIEGDKATLADTELPRLNWEPMIEAGDSWYNSRAVRNILCVGDSLCILTYDDSYNDVMLLYSLTDGSFQEQFMQNVSSISAGPQGQLLISRYIWDGDGGYELSLFDPASGSSEKVGGAASLGGFRSICYSEEKDTLYYVNSGEILAVPGLDFSRAVPVNDCPLESESGAMLLPDDRLLIYDYRTAVLRTTDPEKRQAVSLRVTDYAYIPAMDSAYYDFTADHGSVAVIIDRYETSTDILQAMMNQDSTTDIYCLRMSSGTFNALFNRGYMAPLDSSEKLTSLVHSMYPAVAEAVTKDGSLVAVPLCVTGNTIGFNSLAMKRAGLTEEDLPRTWEGFFDFLEQLPERMEGTGVRAFPRWNILADLKTSLLNLILSDWEAFCTRAGTEISFSDPRLQNLLSRLEKLDAEALGVSREYEEDAYYEWVEDGTLLEMDVPLTMPTYNVDFRPLMLAIEGDPISSYQVDCAFINPYSAHPAEALAFLEAMAGRTGKADAYTMSPENNEPVRYPDYEEYKENLTTTVKETREQLEKEEDENARAELETYLEEMEKSLGSLDDTYWMISPASIAAYQARAPFLSPARYGMQSMMAQSTDTNLYELFNNFASGTATGRELLDQLNKKYMMMLQEGN